MDVLYILHWYFILIHVYRSVSLVIIGNIQYNDGKIHQRLVRTILIIYGYLLLIRDNDDALSITILMSFPKNILRRPYETNIPSFILTVFSKSL